MQHLLNKTGVIQRKTLAQDAIGEMIETYATAGTYPTRYAKASNANVGIISNYQKTEQDYLFFFAQGCDILLEDRISIDNKIFNVKSVDTFDGMTTSHHMEVIATLVQFG